MNDGLTLAITTIGDLLLKNLITKAEDGNSIENVELTIPDYQRPYKWTSKNAIQLLDDIIEARAENKEVYRVGTLILNLDTKGHYNIVDGQQRTITFALLLKALGCMENIAFFEQELPDNAHTRYNLANNYRSLQRRARTLKEQNQQDDLLKFIETKCELIVVITRDLSEAFQFFDSQNARGKKLYPHDLLKAFHLREMTDQDELHTQAIVKTWEDMNQWELASLFGDYLYRVKEWIKGNRPDKLTEQNIDKFKGVTRRDNSPYAQFYKSAVAYAQMVNSSAMPFVSGTQDINYFQIDAPIVAGKPFFDYAKHYYDLLGDIQNNDKYVGYFINGNCIVETLNRNYRYGVGNCIARLLFDAAALLYVDRYCPMHPSKSELEFFDQFVELDFIWAYSLRAQYTNLGWLTAQNYVMGTPAGGREVVNAFNMFKLIAESVSAKALLSQLTGMLNPLPDNIPAKKDGMKMPEKDEVCENYLSYFKKFFSTQQ